MNKVGIFNCPEVEKNDYIEFVYQCSSSEDENYYKRAKGKVVDVRSQGVLVELPKYYKQIGNIFGWKIFDKLYWWVETYRKIENKLEIE